MKESGPFSPVLTATKMLTAIAIAVILLGSSFTVISAQQQQQQMAPQTGEIENTTGTLFWSTSDSFSIQVPNGWIANDHNNTGFELSEELRRGYGLLAQLCPEQEQGAGALSTDTASAANNATSNNRCQGAQEEIVHIIRYPDLNIRMQPTSNLTQYHLQTLQEVGYRNMQVLTTTDVTVNLTNPLTNETILTVPAEFADVTYTTAVSPNETRTGHYVLTSTNNTAPNATATKGYAVFYEGNSRDTNSSGTVAAITPTSTSLPLSTQAAQLLASFELIATPGVAETLMQQATQPAVFTEDTTEEEVEEEEEVEAEEEEDEGEEVEDEEEDEGEEGSLEDCVIIGDGDVADDCDFLPDADNDGGDDDGAGDEDGGGDDDGA